MENFEMPRYKIIVQTKGQKADWNQINHCQSTANQSNLDNQKFSFFLLEFT